MAMAVLAEDIYCYHGLDPMRHGHGPSHNAVSQIVNAALQLLFYNKELFSLVLYTLFCI